MKTRQTIKNDKPIGEKQAKRMVRAYLDDRFLTFNGRSYF